MKYFKMFLKKLLRYVLKPLSFLPALMMMFVIFNFSAQDGTASSSVSSTVSVRFVQVCDRALDRGWSDAQIAHYAERIEHYVRKLAHVTEYFLLAVAVSFPQALPSAGLAAGACRRAVLRVLRRPGRMASVLCAGPFSLPKGCGYRQHRYLCRD
ncbi:MAG: VanZ family protein [Eisenbergiella massiliensis]